MGPFLARVRTPLSHLAGELHHLYRDYEMDERAELLDFHVTVDPVPSALPWREARVRFRSDGRSPFEPMPLPQALPALEWGINLAIAMRANHLLMLHSAVVERHGRTMLFPAWPGAGKTTLCAALVNRGWRLFSDEFGLITPGTRELTPLPRLMPLKNESIEVIRRFAPEAVLGPVISGTRKGDLAHVRPPAESIRRADERAEARWIVFPRWESGAPLQLEPMPPAQAFLMLATNAFNYEVLGEVGFRTVAEMIRTCGCYRLTYSALEEVVPALEGLVDANG